MERREFINTLSRISILSAILVVTGVLAFRKRGNNNCDYNFACKHCNKNTVCNLPESKQFRNTPEYNKNSGLLSK